MHNDWKLSAPWGQPGLSFLGIHFMVQLWVANIFSWLLPLELIEFFALYMALTYTLFALSMFYALRFFTNDTRWHALLAVAIAVATGFNSLITGALWMPHVEFAMPVGVAMFLMHYALGNRKLTITAFIYTLSAREDAGFHLVAPLGLLMLADYYRNRDIAQLKRHAMWIIIAISYSLFAVIMTHALSQMAGVKGVSVFTRIYTGTPPYAHLSWELIGQRFADIATSRLFLWLAMLLMAIRAFQTRDVILGVGLLAYAPWMLLHLMASYPPTAIMYAYYIFPFMLFAFWPVLAAFWRYGRELPAKVKRDTLTLQAAVALLLLMTPSPPYVFMASPANISKFMPGKALPHREEMLQVLKRYTEDKTLANKAVAINLLPIIRITPEDGIKSARFANMKLEHLFYIHRNRERASPIVMALAQSNKLTYRYCLEGTGLCLLSRYPREQLATVVQGLVDAPVPAKWHNHPAALKLLKTRN